MIETCLLLWRQTAGGQCRNGNAGWRNKLRRQSNKRRRAALPLRAAGGSGKRWPIPARRPGPRPGGKMAVRWRNGKRRSARRWAKPERCWRRRCRRWPDAAAAGPGRSGTDGQTVTGSPVPRRSPARAPGSPVPDPGGATDRCPADGRYAASVRTPGPARPARPKRPDARPARPRPRCRRPGPDPVVSQMMPDAPGPDPDKAPE